jgi:WD40 repeat protein
VGEIGFIEKVRNVKMRSEKIFVVLEKRTYVYNFTDLKEIQVIETCSNLRGIIAVNYDGDKAVLVLPDKIIGKALMVTYSPNNPNREEPRTIDAHQSAISYLAVNPKGTLLATSSEKGTVIRVFNTETRYQSKTN